MSYTIAPACRALLAQATQRAPGRDRSHDGLVGDLAHAARRSWHNPSLKDGTPDPDGVVLAVDLSHDPANGCDAHGFVREAVARRDRRVKEAISLGRIWTLARADEGWRRYSGSNPHDKHAHVTVTWEYRNSTAPWWPVMQPAPNSIPVRTPEPEDEPMTPDDKAWLTAMIDDRVRILLRAEDRAGKPTGHDSLRALREDVRALGADVASLDVPRKA